MSDLTVMEAMVARELWNTADDYGHPEDYIEQARTLIHSLRPIIETEVRERIAAEVRAWCHEERHGQAVEGDRWITVLCGDCEELAARIARGQS